jgi:uncharacterized protein
MASWLTRFILGRYAKKLSRQFAGSAPAKSWDGYYNLPPFELIELALQKVPKAAYVMGDRLDQGMDGLEQNFEKALVFYRLAEEIEDADALNNLGSMHHHGDGLPQNFKLARTYYERAVEAGCAAAMNNLGRFYLQGEAGCDRDIPGGMALLERAADHFEQNAALKLAFLHLYGKQEFGIIPDLKKRLYWLYRAAYNGSGAAYCILGDLYRNGETIPKNMASAIAFYKQAVSLGDADAAFQLGLYYFEGNAADAALSLQYLQLAQDGGLEQAADFISKLRN